MKKILSFLFVVAITALVATSTFAATPTGAPASIKFEINPAVLANHYGETMLIVDRILNGVRFGTPTQVAPDQASNTPVKRLPDADDDIVFGRPNRIAPGQASNTPVRGAPPVTFQILVQDCNLNQIADSPPTVQHFSPADSVIYITTCPGGSGVCTFQYWKDPVFGSYWLGIQDAQKDARGQLVYDTSITCPTNQ